MRENFHFFQEGFMSNFDEFQMRANSVRIIAQKLSTNFSNDSCGKTSTFSERIYVQFWLASDAHKFSKDSCGKIVQISVRNSVELGVALDAHKFSKDSSGKIAYTFH